MLQGPLFFAVLVTLSAFVLIGLTYLLAGAFLRVLRDGLRWILSLEDW